jgi:transposase-like protein
MPNINTPPPLRQSRAGRTTRGPPSSFIPGTNPIESLNARFRRAVNARGHFPNEQSALKVLYLTICSLDPTGKGRARWTNRWKSALNAFDIAFDGRVSAGRR